MAVTRLPESPDYMARREELRQAELELMRQREHVAALRRDLPTGLALEDYVFEEGPPLLAAGDTPVTKVRLSELFTSPDRPLIIYHLMYGKQQTSPCPMCTCWVDGFNGVARHLAQNVDFAVVAAADPGTLRAHARARGWDKLRLLSCADNTFQYDLGAEDAAGPKTPPSRSSRWTPTERPITSTRPIRGWLTTSISGESISSTLSGIFSISHRRGAGTGTPSSTTTTLGGGAGLSHPAVPGRS